jgi:hypothetical protein
VVLGTETRRRGSTNRRPVLAMRRQGLGLGRWGAHGHGAQGHPPAKNHHGAEVTEAWRALDTRHGITPRGDPRPDKHWAQHECAFTKTAGMATWGCFGVMAPQGRRGSSIAHGGGDGAPALGGTKACPQARKQGEKLRETRKATALTAG